MLKSWRRIITTAALAFMLCLTGLVMSGEAQAQRFVDNGNGTVTDTVTNLMWTKNANPFGSLDWQDAISRCRSFSISGIGGWRLPNRDELVTLFHAMKGGHPFTGVQSPYYWTSVPNADRTDFVWSVSMLNGSVSTHHEIVPSPVWPVRAGQ